jgi:outer membrane lipoprotein-sorting protein
MVMKVVVRMIILVLFVASSTNLQAQDMTPLVNKVKAKLDLVNDYTAEGKMKTNIAFIKAPLSKIKVVYKKPNKFKIKRDGGISVLPKGGVSINLNTVMTMDNFVSIGSGEAMVGGVKTKIVKLLPTDENSDVVVSTLYIDEANLLIRRATTTTRENGTFDMELTYGKFANYGLPDKVIFSFNAKDYKLPKGITLEFESGEKPTEADKLKMKKGKVEITYASYIVNKGVADSEFK